MKKKIVILAVILLVAAGLYAEGKGEDSFSKHRNQVTVTGTLQFVDGLPVISADSKTYKILSPRFMREAYTLKPGLALTVEGFIVQPGPQPQGRAPAAGTLAAAESIFVRKVTIDGKTYETHPERQLPGGPFGADYRPGRGRWEGQRENSCGDFGGGRWYESGRERPGRGR
jgi:hypothetical protein